MYSSSIRVPDTSILPLEMILDSDELINQFLQELMFCEHQFCK